MTGKVFRAVRLIRCMKRAGFTLYQHFLRERFELSVTPL